MNSLGFEPSTFYLVLLLVDSTPFCLLGFLGNFDCPVSSFFVGLLIGSRFRSGFSKICPRKNMNLALVSILWSQLCVSRHLF